MSGLSFAFRLRKSSGNDYTHFEQRRRLRQHQICHVQQRRLQKRRFKQLRRQQRRFKQRRQAKDRASSSVSDKKQSIKRRSDQHRFENYKDDRGRRHRQVQVQDEVQAKQSAAISPLCRKSQKSVDVLASTPSPPTTKAESDENISERNLFVQNCKNVSARHKDSKLWTVSQQQLVFLHEPSREMSRNSRSAQLHGAPETRRPPSQFRSTQSRRSRTCRRRESVEAEHLEQVGKLL